MNGINNLACRSASNGRADQQVLGATRDLALAEALDRRQFQLAWAPLGTGRDRSHEGRLARRAAAPLAAGAHPAEIGVVHLDPPRKRRLPLAPRHHRHDLVLHGPGRRLLDPETAAEFHRRDAVLRRHDQVDGCKPECQRQLGRVEDRARRGRCLLLAPVALIEAPTRQHAMPAMAAAGAEEAVRPAQPEQRRAALLLGAEGLAKRLVAQTTHPRCNLEPHNRDPLIRNILRTYSLTCGVSRISRKLYQRNTGPSWKFDTRGRINDLPSAPAMAQPEGGAGCLSGHVRICAGGAGQPASLPRS